MLSLACRTRLHMWRRCSSVSRLGCFCRILSSSSYVRSADVNVNVPGRYTSEDFEPYLISRLSFAIPLLPGLHLRTERMNVSACKTAPRHRRPGLTASVLSSRSAIFRSNCIKISAVKALRSCTLCCKSIPVALTSRLTFVDCTNASHRLYFSRCEFTVSTLVVSSLALPLDSGVDIRCSKTISSSLGSEYEVTRRLIFFFFLVSRRTVESSEK